MTHSFPTLRSSDLLEVADAQFQAVVVVAYLPHIPYFDRAAVAGRIAADADTFGVVAAVAEGRSAARADPLAAARVALFLFFQPLLEQFHQDRKSTRLNSSH